MTTEATPGDLEASMWIVGFFDMLGYRAVLNGLDKYPFAEDRPQQEEVIQALGRAVKSRQRFRKQVEAFAGEVEPIVQTTKPVS